MKNRFYESTQRLIQPASSTMVSVFKAVGIRRRWWHLDCRL